MRSDQIKITLCFLMMLVLPALCFGDTNTQALFEKGNAYYAKSQYKQAITAYKQLVDEGYQSASVYYNLGNANYKDGDLTSALLYYEKARLLSPGDDDINANIRLANSKTTDKIDEAPEFFVLKWWHSFILGYSVSALAIASIIIVLLGSAALILYFFSYSVAVKKTAFYSSIVLFVVSVCVIFVASSQENYFSSHKQAIVFTSSVNVKSAPGDQAATLFVIHEGTKINLFDNSKGWIRMKLANGNEGWVKVSDVKEI